MSTPGSSVRRRELGVASARSLLLTVLGEFVLPGASPVWTGALVDGLAHLRIEEKATRQALSRVCAEGLLSAERVGRRVQWVLTAAGTHLLTEGKERIYTFGRPGRPWDGRWLVLAVSVPESQRQLRHRLRTRLTWAGLGSPMPGLWLTPDAGKEKEVAEVVAELGVDASCFTGPFGTIGDEQRLVHQAWALQDVEDRYRRFLSEVAAGRPRTAGAAFTAQVRLVQEWRRFPFLDPSLPAELLPRTWPGPAAAALFHQRHDRWHPPAQAHWAELSRRAGGRS